MALFWPQAIQDSLRSSLAHLGNQTRFPSFIEVIFPIRLLPASEINMLRIASVFCSIILVVSACRGQEAVMIKEHIPQVGERVKESAEEKNIIKLDISVMGNVQNKEEVKTKKLLYIDTVLANPDMSKKATKIERTYETAELGKDGTMRKLPLEGKTVLIQKNDGKYEFTIDGNPIEGESLSLLNNEFNKPNKPSSDLFWPKMPVKPGDSWKMPVADLLKSMSDSGLVLDEKKATATGKLLKVSKKNGSEFGDIEFSFEAPVTGLGPKAPITIKEGKMSIKSSIEACIDGSNPAGKGTTRVNALVVGSGMGVEIKVENSTTETKSSEPLPKK